MTGRTASPLSRIRRTEWVLGIFQVYAAAMAAFEPIQPLVRYGVFAVNISVLLIYALLIRGESACPRRALSIVRDWLPLGLVLAAYWEMGWLTLPHTDFHLEENWAGWDRLVLRRDGRAVIEFFGPVLPALLEISYTLVHTLAPFSVAALYIYHRRQRVDAFTFVFILAVLLCYTQFPFWPSYTPRVLFAGKDLPSWDTPFRRFNLWILGNYGIRTSVFPSAHVAAAFSAAFGMRLALPEKRWLSRVLCIVAVLIAVATVYGRYHYLADVVAGFIAAVAAAAVASCFKGTTEPGGAATM